tara:strand:+ start:12599 stop:12982 length:384 start_codon:yes stop_codon:yes gene_type:complete
VYESVWVPAVSYMATGLWLAYVFDLGFQDIVVWLPVVLISAVLLQYFLWRKWLLSLVVDKFVPTKYAVSSSRLIGVAAKTVEVDGRVFVSVQDELWPCDQEIDVGILVRIERVRRGVLEIQPIKESS